MCTVVIEIPETPYAATRLLAVRDEDPARAWDAPGPWWPELPGVLGVRDRRAGGAWLAAKPASGRLAVILNRAERTSDGPPASPNGLRSRGGIVLEGVEGRTPADPPGTANFNLVSVEGHRATVTSWDGESLAHHRLDPGVHMIAHHGVDDPRSARIEAWLPHFRTLAGAGDDWREHWIALLARTAQLPGDDDRAIIRDNTAHGYPTMSLLACIAEVRGSGGLVRLETAVLAQPAVWDSPAFG